MTRSDDVHKTKSELCRTQLTMWSPRRGSCFESKSEYVAEELSMCCCNKNERTKTHVKNVMLMVFRGLKREIDSEKAIGLKEFGRFGEESNTTDSIIVVEFDTRVLRESRQMEIDLVNQLDVNCKRPRQWASSFPVIPTKCVDVNGGSAKQLEYCSRPCEKDLKRLSFNVKCATFDMMSRTSEVAIEPQPDEHVVCQDFTDLSNSLSEIRKEKHNWKTKWRPMFVSHKPKSSTVVCCHELCGFVHGDDIIITGDSAQWMWIESRLKEKLNFERCAHLGVDDGADKTVIDW